MTTTVTHEMVFDIARPSTAICTCGWEGPETRDPWVSYRKHQMRARRASR